MDKRQRRSDAEWQQLIEQQQRSGLMRGPLMETKSPIGERGFCREAGGIQKGFVIPTE